MANFHAHSIAVNFTRFASEIGAVVGVEAIGVSIDQAFRTRNFSDDFRIFGQLECDVCSDQRLTSEGITVFSDCST